ncbi:MAG: PPOX class F420-dependent oxidoreductase [Ardenticatenaceae bacterium]|nr:PPOX class F420-dependent oxidoreductase [Ardenticatenaceae bacterium]MCB9445437.1 PPOX class F420-dependent oxidoreductase [Ardenticatenaceae bacterium]
MSTEQFERQQYINLETFKKNGQGVKTPVWFVMENGVLYTRTLANSWKVKRLNRNPQIKVVPCDARGNPLGTWVDGRAYEITDPAEAGHVDGLMTKKYGLLKRAIEWIGKMRQQQRAAIRIEMETAKEY